MNIVFRTPSGETLMGREIAPERVEIVMERLLKVYQADGLHVRKIAPGLFDISRRDGKDNLHRLGSLVVE